MQSFLRREAPITTSPPSLIVFVGTSGAAGKATATGLTCTALNLVGVLTRIIELDEQGRHAKRHVTVTSVDIPTSASCTSEVEPAKPIWAGGRDASLPGRLEGCGTAPTKAGQAALMGIVPQGVLG
jgi:hypothetical protein